MDSIFISSSQNYSGTVSISLYFMHLLKAKYPKVAYFKPIIEKNDTHIDLIKEYFSLSLSKKDSYVYTVEEAEKMVSNNETNKIIENIIHRYEILKRDCDFVFIQGLSKEKISSSIGDDLNIQIAKNLSIPYINIINGRNKSNELITEEVKIESDHLKKLNIDHFLTFVNQVEKENIPALKQNINSLEHKTFILPFIKELSNLSVDDIYKSLECKLVYGKKRYLNQQIFDIKVASMMLENFLYHIKEQDLIVVSGDRSDIVAGTVLSLQSKTSQKAAAILLTADMELSNSIVKILEGLEDLPICILSTNTITHDTVMKLTQIKPKITPASHTKISLILGTYPNYIDSVFLKNKLKDEKNHITTPLMFEYGLSNIAKQNKQNIVLPESGDDRILRAAEILLNKDLVNITLLGTEQNIKNRSKLLGIDISKANIIDPKISHLSKTFANELYELRKHKGLTKEGAYELIIENPNYFGTMMVKTGCANGMVSGAAHTTADTVRPALQIIKTTKGIDIVSSLFFMCLETKVLIYADCAINQNPNENELAQIAVSSAKTAKEFGITPKVAMLSYSTGDSGSGEDVQKVIKATNILKSTHIDFDVEGPIQYDAAIDKEVALKKLPDSKVAGVANVLIFPDLNTGNNTYKAVQRSSGAVAIGPILQGLNKPVNDLSRGCTVKDIVNTVIITAIQAQQTKA